MIRQSRIGKKHSEETKFKIGNAQKYVPRKTYGENHHNWQGGITIINEKIRKSIEYKLWRKSVFERDNYTCVLCDNNTSGNLNADHIKQFAYYPELRFALDNGRTLCIPCHRKTPTWGRRIKNLTLIVEKIA